MTFEEAYARLEKILETMNLGNVPLEESLNLYEEADQLLKCCQEKLTRAEQKVEMLIKQRNGSLTLDEQEPRKKRSFTLQMPSDETPAAKNPLA